MHLCTQATKRLPPEMHIGTIAWKPPHFTTLCFRLYPSFHSLLSPLSISFIFFSGFAQDVRTTLSNSSMQQCPYSAFTSFHGSVCPLQWGGSWQPLKEQPVSVPQDGVGGEKKRHQPILRGVVCFSSLLCTLLQILASFNGVLIIRGRGGMI